MSREHRELGAVRLRAIEPSDLATLKVWRNDLKDYFREYRYINDLHQEAWYKTTLGDKSVLHYAIDVWDNGWLLVGSCNWSSIDWLNRHAELGIYIGDPGWRSKGIGLKAMLRLHEIAFDELNFNVVHLEVWGFSDATRFYVDFGYKKVGICRRRIFYQGALWDSVAMDMTRDEWRELYGEKVVERDTTGPVGSYD